MIWDQMIEGRCVRLRSAKLEDAQFTYDIRQDSEKIKYLHPVKGSLERQREWLQRQQEREGDYFFIVETKEGTPIGTTSVYNIQGEEGELGRLLLYGTPVQNAEVSILERDFAFYDCGLKKLRITVHEDNIHVQGLVKRLGAEEDFRRYDDELGCNQIYYHLTEEMYRKKRNRVERNIELLV